MLKEDPLRKAVVVKGPMQTSLDTGKPMSGNNVSVEIDEQVMSTWVSLAEIEVSGEVILGYVSPSWPEVPNQTPMGNLDRTQTPIAFE